MEMQWAKSETIGKLAESLSKAQGKFRPVLKENENPAYRGSKYADLATIIDATKDSLAAEGIAVIQMPHAQFGEGDAKMITVTTLLAHSSGEWISCDLTMPAMMRDRFDSQSCGSAVTYARRYSLQAMLGVAADIDDDGNKAAGVGTKEAANAVAAGKLRKAATKTGDAAVCYTEWKEGFIALSGGGLAIVKAEIEPETLLGFGFKMDGNVVTMPAAKAHAFEDLCKRASVEVYWAQSAKKGTNGEVGGTANR